MKKIVMLFFCFVTVFMFEISFAEEITLWESGQYLRTTGSPNTITSMFTTSPGMAKIIVKNGIMSSKGKLQNALTSASISVNGEKIFGPSDFKKKVHLLEAPLNLAKNNEFLIELASKPGSHLTIEITREIALPPDPGEEGAQTLLGIDSDNDGVRDDIQRYIYITYPNEEKVRLALFQIGRNFQELLPDADDPEIAHENVKKLYRSRTCLYYIKNGVRNAKGTSRALKAEILNTKERSQAYIKFNNSLAGKTTEGIPFDERKNCCLFDVEEIGEQQ